MDGRIQRYSIIGYLLFIYYVNREQSHRTEIQIIARVAVDMDIHPWICEPYELLR